MAQHNNVERKMKSLIKIVLLLSASLLVNNVMASKVNASEVVATVNGVKITRQQLDMHIQLLQTMTQQKIDNQAAALADLVDREIIQQEVKKTKLDKDPELTYLAEFQRRELFSKALLKKSKAGEPITDAELQKLYNEKIKNLDMKEYKIRHILIKSSDPDGENKAKAIVAELDKGNNFEDVAKAKSQDPSASKGGDLGWLNLATLRGVPAIAQAISEMTKGKYSKTPVKSEAGWHIIKLDDVRKKEPPTLEQSKKQLSRIIQQTRIQDYVAGLRGKAKIDIKLK